MRVHIVGGCSKARGRLLRCRAKMSSEVAKPTLTEDEARAAKRKEIEEKLAALKLQKEKEAEQKTRYFGNHPGITCDGCGVGPIVGYRYKCKSCPNHDVCETCYDQTKAGKVENGLGKQVISANAADHKFELFKDKAFSSLVKSAKVEGATEKKVRGVAPSRHCMAYPARVP